MWTRQHIAVGKGDLADTGNESARAGSYVGMVVSVGASVGTQVEEIRQTPWAKAREATPAVVRCATAKRKVPGAWRWVLGVLSRNFLI